MKPTSILFLFTLIVTFSKSQGSYFLDNYPLNEFGAVESSHSINQKAGAYYCEKYQPTILPDSKNPITLTLGQIYKVSQRKCVQFFKFQLNKSIISQRYINLKVDITRKQSSSPISSLFAYEIGSPPLLTYNESRNVTFGAGKFKSDL
mgnify:FL=1